MSLADPSVEKNLAQLLEAVSGQTVTVGLMPARMRMTVERTCSRCGELFYPCGRSYMCGLCKIPMGDRPPHLGAPFTAREKQVCRLLAEAHANKEIAATLHLTKGTVKDYMHNLFLKTGSINRTGLALWLMRHREQWK